MRRESCPSTRALPMHTTPIMSELRCTILYFIYRIHCLVWLGSLSSKRPRSDSMEWMARLFNSMSPPPPQSSKRRAERLANVAIRHHLLLKCRRWGSRLDTPRSIEARLTSNSKSDVEDASGFFTANLFLTLPSRGKAREVIKEFGECVIGVIAGRITSVLAVGDISVLDGPTTRRARKRTRNNQSI